VPPPIPDYGDTIPPSEDIPEAPPESPEETTMELPPIPAAPDPSTALRSEGITAPETGEDDGEYEEGEYEQLRSLADRLGDWLEFRLEKARALHESEAPFREAEIARQAALLEARTAQEVAMMEQNGKLHAAMMKAKGDKAAARGKADADRMKSSGSGSGLGADKGRSKAGGGGGGSRGSNSGGPGGRSGSGSSGGSGGGKGGTKGPDRSSGGRTPGSGRGGPAGDSKGRQNGSGGSGGGKSGTGKGNSGGSGKGGSGSSGSGKGASKGDGGKTQHSPASSPGAERARGRQERAGTRQAGRQERRTADHAAGLADRTKDRDQARAQRQQAWEDRRAKKAKRDAARKAKRKAARKAKREAAASEPDRTTFGKAVGEEVQRRWDKRHADAKDGKDGTERVSPAKDKVKEAKGKGTDGKGEKDAKGGPDEASSATKDDKASDESGKDSKAADEPSDGSKKKRRRFRRRTTGTDGAGWRRRTRGPRRARRTGRRERPADSPFGAEDSTPTVEWPEHDTRPPKPAAKDEDDIVDADIVPDGPAAVTTGVKGLPPAPEEHTERPGTSRPTSTEGSSVSSSQVSRPSRQSGLGVQHRTDITFDEYLVKMANIAIKAASDQERAEALMEAFAKLADALREMAADLAGDHNIDTELTDLIADLADSATTMKIQAQRCAEQCGIAKEAAKLAAQKVARVYGEDMAAKEDAGLTHASAAAHHD
jgi:hypothetical protein